MKKKIAYITEGVLRSKVRGEKMPFSRFMDLCSYRPKGYQFSPKYQDGVWDGKVRLAGLLKDGSFSFPTGLLHRVREFLFREGYRVKRKVTYDKSIRKTKVLKLKESKLRKYQRDAVKMSLYHKRGIIKLPTACLTKNCIIPLNRGKRGFSISIKRLYENYNNLSKNPKYNYDKRIKTKIRYFNGEEFKLQEILDVVYSGIKPVYRLVLENGNFLEGTKDHRIVTKRGWVELGDLIPEKDKVVCDRNQGKQKLKKKKVVSYPEIWNLWYHPYAVKMKVLPKNKGKYKYKGRVEKQKHYTMRVRKHRLVFEAAMNGLELDEFIKILRTDKELSKKLKYLDPKDVIHHKDGDVKNFEFDNLEKLNKRSHPKLHNTTSTMNRSRHHFSKVLSVRYVGKRKTYDIECSETPNFIANRMVVHNSGKTLIASSIIRSINRDAILLTNKKELLYQTKEVFQRELTKDVGIFGDALREFAPITIGSIPTLYQNFDYFKEFLQTKEILIIDEVHHAVAKTWYKLSQKLPCIYRIGLTATPTPGPHFIMLEACTGKIIYTKPAGELIEEGYLSAPIIFMVEIDKPKLPERFNYHKAYDKGVVRNKYRNRTIARLCRRLVKSKKYRPIVVQTRKLDHYHYLQKELDRLNLKHEYLSGSDDSGKRVKVMNDLKKDRLDILVVSTIFDEAVDIPNIRTLIIASGGKDEKRTIQRLGRSMRRLKNKTSVLVLDFYDDTHDYLRGHSKFRMRTYKREGYEVEVEGWKKILQLLKLKLRSP